METCSKFISIAANCDHTEPITTQDLAPEAGEGERKRTRIEFSSSSSSSSSVTIAGHPLYTVTIDR